MSNQSKMSSIIGVLACAGLVACGGSSANTALNNGGGTEPTLIFPNFVGANGGRMSDAAIQAELDTLTAFLGDLETTGAEPERPAGTQATLRGMIGSGDDDQFVGNLTLNANFANSTFTGATSDFAIFEDSETPVFKEALDGSLQISNGQIITEQVDGQTVLLMSAELDGSLSDSNGVYVIDAEMIGRFFSIDGKNVSIGEVEGTQTGPSQKGQTTTTPIVDGAFFAFE